MLLSELLAKATLATPAGVHLNHEVTPSGIIVRNTVNGTWDLRFPDQTVKIDENGNGNVLLATHEDTFLANYIRFKVVITFSPAALHAKELRDLLQAAYNGIAHYRETTNFCGADDEFLSEAAEILEKTA